jgi:hypothetical protein
LTDTDLPPKTECWLRVNIDECSLGLIKFGKADGKYWHSVLNGYIDEESLAGSEFSFQPIEIKVVESPSIFSKNLKKYHGDNAVGVIDTKATLEEEEFEHFGETFTVPAINAILHLPGDVIEILHKQFASCKSENEALVLRLHFEVLRSQLKPETNLGILGCRLGDLDVSVAQTFVVFEVETSVDTVKDWRYPQSRFAPGDFERGSTEIVIRFDDSSIHYNFQRGKFEHLQIRGKVRSKDNISVSIDLKEIYREIKEKQKQGQFFFNFTDRNNGYLSLTLNYYADQFTDLILPLMRSGTTNRTFLSVILEDTINFTEQKSGNVYSFSFYLEKEYLAEKQINFEEKFDQLDERLDSIPSIINEQSYVANKQFFDGINRQMQLISARFDRLEELSNMPNDIVSRLIFKIPLVGPLIKFLIR